MGYELVNGFITLYTPLGTKITAPPPISTPDKSLQAKSSQACSVLSSRFLVTASNSGDS
jgi:hypothetical protein